LLLATPVLLYSAQPFYLSAWRSLRHRHLNMDVPVSAALLGAYFASLYATLSGSGEIYFESVSMFTFFLLLGRYLELQVRQKATQASANLSKLIPQLAVKLEQGEEREVLSRHLQPGDLVRVLPGAWLPADGLIREGTASLDEAMLTGESLPVLKSPGEAVYAGTINTDSPLLVCVTQPPGQTLADQIMRLQDQALSEKPRLAKLADHAAGYFVAGLLLLASLTYAYWSWQDRLLDLSVRAGGNLPLCPGPGHTYSPDGQPGSPCRSGRADLQGPCAGEPAKDQPADPGQDGDAH